MNNIVGKLFMPEDVLSKIKSDRAVRRKRRVWGKSRINILMAELLNLKEAGASYADLEFWLRKEKRIKIHRSNIKRAMDKFKLLNQRQI
ncbi:hypothetical protein GALL_216260 [mine drainage metagenome]|uniref:Uncharacterized protein n=1 Tax=mine drainage metagenome TaxID=410659 RepID=A0A1J5S7T8_9ZZZZ